MTEPFVGDREFRNTAIRLADLTVRSALLEGYVFTNCTILGPGVLALLNDNTMANCEFEGDINSLFWEVDPRTRPNVLGAIGVRSCTFSSCSFQSIGFAGPPELKQQMEREVKTR